MNKKLLTIASIFALSSLTVLAEEVAADTTAEAAAPAATLMEEIGDCEVLSKVSMSLSLGYESQYVFRGVELAGSIITPGLDVGYALTEDLGLYIGYWGAFSVENSGTQSSESDIFLGATYTYDFVSFDAGYTAYTYVGAGDDSNELKFVATFDTSSLFSAGFNLNPYIGFFYDFDYQDQFVTEIGLSYAYSLTEWASLGFAYYMGYADYADSYNADAYFYTGVSLDASIAINEICAFNIGLRYAYNTCDSQEGQNSNIWFGTGISIGF